MTVGQRIREFRTRRKMTPVGLAAAADLTDSAIHQLEQGLSKNPSFQSGLKIAKALGITAWELAFGTERPADIRVRMSDATVELDMRIRPHDGAVVDELRAKALEQSIASALSAAYPGLEVVTMNTSIPAVIPLEPDHDLANRFELAVGRAARVPRLVEEVDAVRSVLQDLVTRFELSQDVRHSLEERLQLDLKDDDGRRDSSPP